MRKMKWISCLLTAMLCFSCVGCANEKNGKQYNVNDYRTTMQFHDDFKVMQIADLHFGIETDVQKQLSFVLAAIEEADPDLIILSGDNFMYGSKGIIKTLFSALNEECKKRTAAHPERLTKFAVTYGNHDNQGDYSRYYANETIKAYVAKDGDEIKEHKYAAFLDYEDDNLFGLTNYFIDLVDDRSKDADCVDVKYRLHIIDSNTYQFVGTKYKYDCIRPEQLDHAKKIYAEATADKDYIGMCFFHIPFAEYQTAKEQYESAANPALIGQGEWREEVLHAYEDYGSYEKLKEANIIAFSVGHDHINYGDILYNATSNNFADKAIFSYGVKSTNQLYHDEDMLGYKIYNLKDGMTKEQFLSIENINANFINITDRNGDYE